MPKKLFQHNVGLITITNPSGFEKDEVTGEWRKLREVN
jgi:hypothetical protein